MTDTTATGNYYVLNHVALFTGLTDRTLRNYLSSGILEGEKINGLWHFTPEQVDRFVRHPSVRPSILAKKNAQVYDFLLDAKKERPQCCLILDLPGRDPKEITDYFCTAIREQELHHFHFSFDAIGVTPRVILRGDIQEVLNLASVFYSG